MDQKINNLRDRINRFKDKNIKNNKTTNDDTNHNSGSSAMNIAIELLSFTIVAMIVGFFLDKLFDSIPIFLIICTILSIVAFFKSIWSKYIK